MASIVDRPTLKLNCLGVRVSASGIAEKSLNFRDSYLELSQPYLIYMIVGKTIASALPLLTNAMGTNFQRE